jgi:carbon-monoxide dehydrogenase medium subunit
MKSAPFVHHAATSVAHAADLLARHAPEGGRVLAGGQSLVPMMALRLAQPTHLVDINRVAGLDQMEERDGRLRIPALVRHAAFEAAAEGPTRNLLRQVVRHIAHAPIRTRGTFCGSLAHADPASEWCLVATALGADMAAQRATGTRMIPVSRYFTGIMQSALAEDELLLAVHLPLLPPGTRAGFAEISRRPGDYAMAMALVVLPPNAPPTLAIGAAEPTPRRIPAAEALLAAGDPLGAADAAAATITPMEDAQANASFRRDLVRVVIRRALDAAI